MFFWDRGNDEGRMETDEGGAKGAEFGVSTSYLKILLFIRDKSYERVCFPQYILPFGWYIQ